MAYFWQTTCNLRNGIGMAITVRQSCCSFSLRNLSYTVGENTPKGLAVMAGLFLFLCLQLHPAQPLINTLPVGNELGNLFVELFGMELVPDVSQSVNEDVIDQGERQS